ncbi:MAG: FAD-dependent oxidoreductase, partial [Parvularculaceae bacterium]
MEILVIGAGVIGVTTAYMLSKAGYQVTVIEANSTVASEASHANGGQLSYDFATPMGSPALLRKLPAILAGKDIGFRMAPGFDRHYLGWSAQFLKNCAPARTKENAAKLSSLVTASGKALQTIIAETEIEFKYRKAGKLVVYETETALAATRKAAEGDTNDQLKILSADECRALEPALDHRHAPMAGGVWAADDDVGDAALFTQNLATYCRKKLNARFILGEIVENFLIENNTVRGVLTNSGQTIDADKITCCLGAHGDTLLRPLGIRLPIYPIKGYSIT